MVSSAPESRQLPVELAAEQVASFAAQPVVALKDLSYKVGVCFFKKRCSIWDIIRVCLDLE